MLYLLLDLHALIFIFDIYNIDFLSVVFIMWIFKMFGVFVFTEQQDSLPPDSQTEQEATQAQVHHIATTLNVLKRDCRGTVLYIQIKKITQHWCLSCYPVKRNGGS